MNLRWFRSSRAPQGDAKSEQTKNTTATSSGANDAPRIASDNPIKRAEDDALGRVEIAQSFVDQVLRVDPSEGVVVGVLGPWGSGKTSFINLSRAEFVRRGVTILDVNPWMFSGADHLVESFFVELSAELKLRADLAEVGDDLLSYGEAFSGLAWLPLLGPWLERVRGATKVLGTMLQNRKQGIRARREKLAKALVALDRPVVVVLDDLDRLTTMEIRDVFKLVRLTASFPNIIYVVAFDRDRVEQALTEQGVPGREYLEKILQVAIDLPVVPSEVLNQQIFAAIEGALEGIENRGPFDAERWPDVFAEIVRPRIRHMRDVRRYAAAIQGTVRQINGQISLVDVLGMEAIRVFLPDVFKHLPDAVQALTGAESNTVHLGRDEPPELKAQIDGLLASAQGHSPVVHGMINRLFPAGGRHIGGSNFGNDWKPRWLKERRVAHEDILRLYLERTAGSGLRAFTDAERAWALMADAKALDAHLRSLDPTRLEEVISALELYEDDFAPVHVIPGAVVLLDILPEIPERRRGMFESKKETVVGRVVYRLVRALKDPIAIEEAVRQVLPKLKSISSRLRIVDIVGHREHIGHKLVSERAAADFERMLRSDVRDGRAVELSKEQDLLRILHRIKEGDASEGAFTIDDSPELTLAILKSSRHESLTQAMDSRAVRRQPRLAWKNLVELFGDEAVLRGRVEALKAAGLKGSEDVLELASTYLAGWNPDERDDA